MINQRVWDAIHPYFRPYNTSDKWGDPEKIDPLLLYSLYSLRKAIGLPIHIHCGTQGKHVEGSFHYNGLAVDVHIGKDVPVLDQYLMVEKYNLFTGIGLYPDWNNPGLHLDIGRGTKRPARWVKKNGVYNFNWNYKTLRKAET
jgi:uncharacterized protein YcbK (DUF882 family)